MKLVRYGPAGKERPGVLDHDGVLRDIAAITPDIDGSFLAGGVAELEKQYLTSFPIVEGTPRFGAPVARVGHFIACGLNYRDHAAESNLDLPSEPLLFTKAPSCIGGPNDDVIIPEGSIKVDWEVELGVVIGKGGYRIKEAHAAGHIAGYCLANDLSERDHQFNRIGQWLKGKSHPGFGPLGPWLVTSGELSNPIGIKLTLEVNGVVRQEGNTSDMVFRPDYLVHYISQFMELQPGDVIVTGTPAGVGMGFDPPIWLKDGDVVVVTGEGLGSQRQVFRA
jgi:2-keto-4-pentenoate hydratase/2-oxohepta-3-ene-1,7-dioic acid hydratase in catechol pathway